MIQEILEMLKSIETFVVTNIYNVLTNAKYKLQKDNNITYKLIDAPKFRHIVSNKIDKPFKEPYAEVIDNFVATMKEKLPESSLHSMYHNLKTLKFFRINNPIYSFFYSGSYFFGINGIALGAKNRGNATTTHELLHMSSAIIGKNNMAGGFCTGVVGRNLNEGYTEVLNNRLFGHPITKSPKYNIYSRLANIIEDVVGKDDMTNLYFSADLKGLFERLTFYSSKEKTSLFLRNFDSLFSLYVFNSECLYRIIDYLTEISLKYVNTQIKNGVFTPEEGNAFLQNYRKKINDINIYINQLRNKNSEELAANNNYYKFESSSFKFIQDNNELGYFQIDSENISQKTKGVVSFNLIFFSCIILTIVITLCYLFINIK